MKIKNKVLGVLATTAIVATLLVPSAYADEKTTIATANEGGNVTASLTGNPIGFGAGTVTTETSSQRLVWSGTGVSVSDTQSFNDSDWTVSVTASDLEIPNSAYFIGKENISIWERSNPSCSYETGTSTITAKPVVGGNQYQDYVTYLQEGPGGPGVPLVGDQNVVSGTMGRGCGPSHVGLYLALTVPAGTYTGNGNAVYQGDITLNNTFAVGN
jgi:hypothetical protein